MTVASIPSFRLDGKTALVTGAGAGIGAAISAAFAAAGATVHMVSLDAHQLDANASALRQAGCQVHAHACDVTQTAIVRGLIEGLPALDILVNNAGSNIPEPFIDVTEEHLDALNDLNVRACFLVSQAAVRKMLQDPARAARNAVVVNISSQMGHVGSPDRTVYCMNKHAVEGLTKAMAVELACHGIRVNSVGPTFVDTPLVRRIVDTQDKHDELVSRIPMGRMASVGDIAAAALYLASAAAGMVTGHCLLVDGGWTAQ
ncbi:SDR family NAD(P)-dependent oxidoreductase [Variovorax sp. E3]|uniref:SDR family NAD(P)-dependent oxidoreductase n=1 Tax=Variovorax sp. E3 TaxID=1914993 RepID=UPI0018DE92E6|nr:SDR family oxidoreductase [Variovorax sp. E3]